MPPKRKNWEEATGEETAPKFSLRKQREKARILAKGCSEKHKVGKKSSVFAKKTPAVAKKSPAAVSKKSRTPSKKPAVEVHPRAKRAKLNSGEPKKLTKKQMREEARARAAAWSEKQQVSTSPANSASKKSAATSKAAPSPAVKSPVKKPALNDAKRRSAGKACMETHDQNDEEVYNENDEEMHSEDEEVEEEEGEFEDVLDLAQDHQAAFNRAYQEALDRAHREIMHYQQQQQMKAAMGYGNFDMGSHPQGQFMMSPHQQMTHMQAQVPMWSAGQQSWTSNPSGNAPFQFSAMNASPPPMNAPMMAMPPLPARAPHPRNATTTDRAPSTTMRAPPNSFGAPTPAPKPPAVAPASAGGHRPTMPHPQVHEGEQQHFEQDDEVPEGSKKSRWLGIGVPLLLLSLAVTLIASIAFEYPAKWTMSATTHPIPPPCFLSDPPEDEGQALGDCDRSKGRVTCPDGGFCSSGELRSCNEVHHEVSEGRDQCVLSTSANVTLADVEVLVAGWTVEYFCKIQGCSHAIRREGTSTPFFDLSLIQSKVDVSESLLSMSDAFVLVSGKGEEVGGWIHGQICQTYTGDPVLV